MSGIPWHQGVEFPRALQAQALRNVAFQLANTAGYFLQEFSTAAGTRIAATDAPASGSSNADSNASSNPCSSANSRASSCTSSSAGGSGSSSAGSSGSSNASSSASGNTGSSVGSRVGGSSVAVAAAKLSKLRSSAQAVSARQLQNYVCALFACLDHYDEIWCMTVQDGLEHTQLSSSSATSSSSAATAGRLPARVFGQHAGPVCQLLEASTRCKTDTPVKDAVTSTSSIHGVDPVLILACGTTTVLQLQQPTSVSIGAVLFTAAVKAKAGSTLRLHFYGLLVSACKLLETDPNRLTAPDVLCGELCDATGSFIHSAVLSSNPPSCC